MAFICDRPIYFRDTDAAGVLYFANLLAICHEVYEASLVASGIDLKVFFRNPDQAVPITHAEVDFYRPVTCGDCLRIVLSPSRVSDSEFAIHYAAHLGNPTSNPVGKALTRHVCIHPVTRRRQPLSPDLGAWLQQWVD